MTLLEEYNSRERNPAIEESKRVAFIFADDLCARAGFRHLWNEASAQERESCLKSWIQIVQSQKR